MPFPAWQYHEPDHPGADFDALAGSYDRSMQEYRDVLGEIQEILDFLQLQPDQTILEIGTGTGEFAWLPPAPAAKLTPWTCRPACSDTPPGKQRRAALSI